MPPSRTSTFHSSWWHRLLSEHPTLGKIVANVGWLAFDRLFRMGVGFVVGIATLKYLGKNQAGIIGFASSMVLIASAFTQLAAENILVRESVRTPARTAEILGTGFLLRLIGALITFPVVVLAGIWMTPGQPVKQACIAILAVGYFFQSADVFDCWFQSQLRSRQTVWVRNISFACLTGLKIWLLWTKATLLPFVFLTLADTVVNAASLYWAYRRHSNAWPLKFSTGVARQIFRDSWPLIFSSALINIYMKIDQVMLERMRGDGEAGVYYAAVRFVEVWYFLPMAIHGSVLPGISALAGDPVALRERMQKLYNVMAFLGYAVAIPMTFLGLFLERILGPEYRESGPMLSIFIWSMLFTNLGVARSSFLSTMNWPKVHLFTTILGAGVNVLLNWLWIPKYGGMGAVWASMIAYSLQGIWACFLYRPLRETGRMQLRALVWPRIW